MGIFSRLTDIVNSNITTLLDRAEDPTKMIRLIVQEMEDTLVEVRSDAARLIADRKEVGRRLKRMSETKDEWQKRAELAMQKGREDLARAALLERTKLLDLNKSLEEEDSILTGSVRDPVLGRQAKAEAIGEISSRLGIEPGDFIAVGDGANDLSMLKLAGTGVAMHAKPIVAAEAQVRIDHSDLTALLYLQGYRKSDFSS